jgi:hypothetical protein
MAGDQFIKVFRAIFPSAASDLRDLLIRDIIGGYIDAAAGISRMKNHRC